MPDLSHLDDKYFVDSRKYNCPYCNRRHVSYSFVAWNQFDWNETKKAFVYFVKCDSCEKVSMHLSFQFIKASHLSMFKDVDIDESLFYSVPSSFHVIDERIPKELRELIAEAEGCLKSNFLTGASACVRKAIYSLAVREKAEGTNYEDRLKSLKAILPHIDPTYFDTLLTIQQLTSDKVHEESYDGWQSKHLHLILASLLEALNEIYIIPAVREEKRKSILQLKGEVLPTKKAE